MKVTVKTIKLKLSNCFLVQGEGNILVDAGSPKEERRIVQALAMEGLGLQDIGLILHTHGHIDHAGATKALTNMHDIPTAIHSSDAFMVREGHNGLVMAHTRMAKLIKNFVIRSYPWFEPSLLLSDGDDLGRWGVDGRIFCTPGHTDGSISILLGNGEAIIGDLMMGGYFGGAFSPHKPDYHYFINNQKALDRSIARALEWDVSRYYVGHGGPLAKVDVVARFGKKPT
jgi:glyoxylase-like metal-dependent hydrolase (beta-lactamase superfamily II)